MRGGSSAGEPSARTGNENRQSDTFLSKQPLSKIDLMIRIPLLGQTGNLLFQYALGRVLAKEHGVPLVLDGSWYDDVLWKELSYFLNLPLQAQVVRRCPSASRAMRKLIGKHYWEFRGLPVLKEDPVDHTFDERFLHAPADCVLIGYFQAPKYFESIDDELRTELNGLLAAAVPAGSGPDLAALTQPVSVAVHVRCTTGFVINPVFRVCDMDYYKRSMERMRERVPGARFFIFSDDPARCRTIFTAADQTVLDAGAAASNPLHDLYWMSRASHHIIPNSTYSWWSAWLGAKPGQQVITPDRWFTSKFKAPMEEKWPRRGGGTWGC